MSSINTNVGAMIALQNLNAINSQLMTTQNRISTGLKVASAKDDPATWAIAQRQQDVKRQLRESRHRIGKGRPHSSHWTVLRRKGLSANYSSDNYSSKPDTPGPHERRMVEKDSNRRAKRMS